MLDHYSISILIHDHSLHSPMMMMALSVLLLLMMRTVSDLLVVHRATMVEQWGSLH
jgi:hypothetical protein